MSEREVYIFGKQTVTSYTTLRYSLSKVRTYIFLRGKCRLSFSNNTVVLLQLILWHTDKSFIVPPIFCIMSFNSLNKIQIFEKAWATAVSVHYYLPSYYLTYTNTTTYIFHLYPKIHTSTQPVQLHYLLLCLQTLAVFVYVFILTTRIFQVIRIATTFTTCTTWKMSKLVSYINVCMYLLML